MKRLIISLVVCMSANSIMCGQTLEIESATYNGHSEGLYLDWGKYSTERLDTSLYAVKYDTTVMVDTLTKEKFAYRNILLIGKNVDKFFPEGKLQYELARTRGGSNLKATENQHHVFFYEAVYHDRSTGQTTTTERLCEDDFITTEKTPYQDWTLSDEKKVIGQYECYLAECDFRGRHYFAWYTEEIPMPYGPWKLGGLPGLIVSAYDSEHHYEYNMTEFGTDSTPIFKVNYNYIEIDRGRLNKLTNEILHKPVIYMANHYHMTTRRMRSDRLAKEGKNVYQYDAIEKK